MELSLRVVSENSEGMENETLIGEERNSCSGFQAKLIYLKKNLSFISVCFNQSDKSTYWKLLSLVRELEESKGVELEEFCFSQNHLSLFVRGKRGEVGEIKEMREIREMGEIREVGEIKEMGEIKGVGEIKEEMSKYGEVRVEERRVFKDLEERL